MEEKPSREFNPQGRPLETPNLAGLPRDNGESIDPQLVCRGYANLGHISQKVISPNIGLSLARDLGYYREREEIFNVIRENETQEQLQFNNLESTDLRCHGNNSLKDYLSSTRYESNTMHASNSSPSHLKQNLNKNSSKILPQDFYSEARGKIPISKNNSQQGIKVVQRRPKTGIVKSGRNKTKVLSNTASNP